MYEIKTKMLSIIIIALFATKIIALKKRMDDLSVGDTININELKPESTETYSDLFNGDDNSLSHIFETNKLAGVEKITIEKKMCVPFESLASYYYPSVNVNDIKLDLSKILNFTNQDNLFDISPYYIRGRYSYGIVKVCQVVKSQKLLREGLNQDDLTMLNVHINYRLLLDRTGVLRLRQQNETHYVSSITTGRCFLQVYANLAELCGQNLTTYFDTENFMKSVRYSSRIKITTGNREHEMQINNYADLFKKTLYQLRYLESETSFYDRFKFITEKRVIELDLKTLPDLHETIPPLLLTKNKFLSDIVPGDVINVNNLKSLTSLIEADNILVEVPDHDIPQFTASNFTNCDKFNEDDPVELGIAPYRLQPNYFTETFYKFDVVNEVAKRRNYGVDPKYLNNRYKCLKVKVCSGLKRSKLIIPSVYVINLDKNDINKVRIFDSKNVVLRHKLGNETHYVARTEKGNCLFQALIYENLSDSSHSQEIKGPLLFRGDILSANNDQNLEKWAEEFVNDFPTENYKTLAELFKYQMALQVFNSKLSHESYSNTMINMYLDKLN